VSPNQRNGHAIAGVSGSGELEILYLSSQFHFRSITYNLLEHTTVSTSQVTHFYDLFYLACQSTQSLEDTVKHHRRHEATSKSTSPYTQLTIAVLRSCTPFEDSGFTAEDSGASLRLRQGKGLFTAWHPRLDLLRSNCETTI
jgi:hypothetical protein